jgi:hypothetical protein
MNNDAFSEDPHAEAARILKDTANRLTSFEYRPFMSLQDLNGNLVGECKVKGGRK